MDAKPTYKPPKGTRVSIPPAAGTAAPKAPQAARADAYLAAAVHSASRDQLLMMLIDGAIQFTTRGIEALPAAKAAEALGRAQKIVAELLSSLRPDIGREIYEKLAALYHFCIERLLTAAAKRSAADAEQALRVLNELRTLWIDAIAQMNAHGRPEELETPAQNRVDDSA